MIPTSDSPVSRQGAVSYDEVVQACGRLQARGDRVSQRLVRLEVGRGSLTTIHGHLRAWRAAKPPEGPQPGAEQLRALEALAPAAAAAVRDAFRAEVAGELAAATAAAAAAQLQVEDLEGALRISEEEREQLVDRIRILEGSLQDVSAEIMSASSSTSAQISDLMGRMEEKITKTSRLQGELTEERLTAFGDRIVRGFATAAAETRDAWSNRFAQSENQVHRALALQTKVHEHQVEELAKDLTSSFDTQTRSVTDRCRTMVMELISTISESQALLRLELSAHELNRRKEFRTVRKDVDLLAATLRKQIQTNKHLQKLKP